MKLAHCHCLSSLLLLCTAALTQALFFLEATKCTQVQCQATVCAASPVEAYNVTSLGLVGIMGPDCASWTVGSPVDRGQGECPDGLRTYAGEMTVWRAWTNFGDKYQATISRGPNFNGATCMGRKRVKCEPESKQYPDPRSGTCQPWKPTKTPRPPTRLVATSSGSMLASQ